jgi:RNA polymerase sigma factor (sigma-70 family)
VTGIPDDSRLVTAALAGDRSAFAGLVGRHRAATEALARRLLRDPVEAEDVVQEAILRAYLGLAELRDPSRFGSWLVGIAINLARMRLRRLARAAALPDVLAAPEPTDELGILREALAVLSDAQREVVVMHYVVGLSGREIAELLGRSPGTVRVQLHRARERLREVLPAPYPQRKETEAMIEMTVDDVLAQLEDERPGEQRVVLLREKEGERLLPIWVGPPEGNALALHLGSELPLRPLTIDLAARLLEVTGARIERVVISRLHESVFYASVVVGREEVDARPSDALNLAVRVGAPIYVGEEVLEQAGFPPDGDLSTHLEREAERVWGAERPTGRWESLSGELAKSLYAFPGRPRGTP